MGFGTILFCFSSLYGSILFLSDVFTDVALAIQYFLNGDYDWGYFTIGAVFLPWIGLSVGIMIHLFVDSKFRFFLM